MFSTYFPPHYSGAAKQAISLAMQLRNRGHHIEFATAHRQGDAFEDTYEGFSVHRFPMGCGKHREFKFWWHFLRFLAENKNHFDILHSHGAYYLNSVIGPLGKVFKKKTVIKTSLADNDLAGAGRGITGRLHLFFLKQIDACIAISKELVKEFETLKFPDEKVVFLPNGVDTDRFKPIPEKKKQSKKRTLNFKPDQPVALTVGVFDKRKNIGWLLNEWIRHKGFDTGALLLAIGPQSREDINGQFFNELRETAGKHPDLVRIMGHADSIEEYYQIADFYILPSTNEGMPNVILEAMASGLPCITTPVSGCRDLIREGKTGFFFPPNDIDGLEQALKKLTFRNLRSMGASTREEVKKNFSLIALAKRYESLYHDLCS